ncbi:MAG: hypothetical protein JWR69_100, partial [Pedosphaera sp.]|nr:hypothetical protein [Pedosphaera sp.]
MKNRTQLILLLLCVTAALAFGGYQVFRASSRSPQAPVGPFTDRARLAEFSTNGVTVMVSLESDPQGQPLLRATFTPTNHEFHLYSKDPEAAGGIGLPTTLELLSHSSVKASGPVFADTSPQPHEFKALGVTL